MCVEGVLEPFIKPYHLHTKAVSHKLTLAAIFQSHQSEKLLTTTLLRQVAAELGFHGPIGI